jgi:hypothetical protein
MKNMRWALLSCVILLACVTSLALPAFASTVSTTATGTMPLTVSNVQALNITVTTANISWQTNGNSNSQVFYDSVSHTNTDDYASHSALDSALVLNHNIQLTGLSPNTTYHYRVKSVAMLGGIAFTAVSSDYTFNTLTPELITVRANPQTKVYGSADPLPFTYTCDTPGVTFTGALSRAAGENDGTYVINQGTLSAGSNYNIVYTGANLTISPASLTVTAVAKSKVYGASDPPLTYVATGFVNGDTSSILTGSLSRVSGQNVGNYSIIQSTLSAGSNYTIKFVSANFSITKSNTNTTVTSSKPVCLIIALLFGCKVTFTANVAPAPPLSLSGLSGPTGTVTFYDGKAKLGTGTLSSSGMTSVRTCPLTVIIYALFCNHTITAVYSGDSNFTPSTSPALTERIPW